MLCGPVGAVRNLHVLFVNCNATTRTIQGYLGHKSIKHTVRYTELAPTQFMAQQGDYATVGHIGKILTEPAAPPQYCLVTETSEGGVRIYTASDFEAPSVFTLRFEGTEARCKVIWRNQQFVGAELAPQETSPVNP
jgi:hypothetical protein